MKSRDILGRKARLCLQTKYQQFLNNAMTIVKILCFAM